MTAAILGPGLQVLVNAAADHWAMVSCWSQGATGSYCCRLQRYHGESNEVPAAKLYSPLWAVWERRCLAILLYTKRTRYIVVVCFLWGTAVSYPSPSRMREYGCMGRPSRGWIHGSSCSLTTTFSHIQRVIVPLVANITGCEGDGGGNCKSNRGRNPPPGGSRRGGMRLRNRIGSRACIGTIGSSLLPTQAPATTAIRTLPLAPSPPTPQHHTCRDFPPGHTHAYDAGVSMHLSRLQGSNQSFGIWYLVSRRPGTTALQNLSHRLSLMALEDRLSLVGSWSSL